MFEPIFGRRHIEIWLSQKVKQTLVFAAFFSCNRIQKQNLGLRYFPELQKLSVEKRKKYTIVNDKTILFAYSDSAYHLEDLIGLEGKWQKR